MVSRAVYQAPEGKCPPPPPLNFESGRCCKQHTRMCPHKTAKRRFLLTVSTVVRVEYEKNGRDLCSFCVSYALLGKWY